MNYSFIKSRCLLINENKSKKEKRALAYMKKISNGNLQVVQSSNFWNKSIDDMKINLETPYEINEICNWI